MAEFGWAYVAGQSPAGATGSLQFKTDVGEVSGSNRLSFNTSSFEFFVSGSSKVVGTSFSYGFSATEIVGNKSIIAYDTVVGENYNSLLLGPITISDGVSVTIGSGSVVMVKDLTDM